MATGGEENLNTSLLSGSECLYDYFCQPCSAEGKHLEAVGLCVDCQEHLCKKCFKHHTRPSVTRHHVLLSKDQMDKEISPPEILDRCTELCAIHKGEIVKYFCPVHFSLGCSVCITLNHRNCEDMKYVPDVSKNIVNTEEFKEFEMKIQHIVEKSSSIKQTAENKMESVANCHIQLKDAIKVYREQVNGVLDEIESDLDKKAEEIKEKHTEAMNTLAEKCTSASTDAKTVASQTQHLQKNLKNCDTYIYMKKSRSHLELLECELSKAENESYVTLYAFKPNTGLFDLLRKPDALGKLCPKGTTVEHLTDINVKTDKDSRDCWITGSLSMPDNKLLIIDHNNEKIKEVDTTQNKVISEMVVAGEPRDITKIYDTKVAVSLFRTKKIVFIRTYPDLKVEESIQVNGKCAGLVHKSDRLYVSFPNEGKIHIMDMKGSVIRNIATDDNGQALFQLPFCIAVSSDIKTLYVSNFSSANSYIVKLNLNGKVMARYTDNELNHTRQAAVSGNGLVYVCSEFTHSVHVITEDCNKVSILLSKDDGLYEPYSICLNEKCDTLYIGMVKNVMKVFHLI